MFDRFTEYQEELKRKKREEFKHQAVFPCKLRVMPNFVFNSRDPIVAGVIVEAGIVRMGTPLCVPTKEVSCDVSMKMSVLLTDSFFPVLGDRHLHVHRVQPQGGGDGAQGRGGLRQDRAHPGRIAQNVRQAFRREGSPRQQGNMEIRSRRGFPKLENPTPVFTRNAFKCVQTVTLNLPSLFFVEIFPRTFLARYLDSFPFLRHLRPGCVTFYIRIHIQPLLSWPSFLQWDDYACSSMTSSSLLNVLFF